jgi:hypothetical protein
MQISDKGLRVDVFAVLERCIEEGYKRGYNRSFKYQDNPTPGVIEENINEAIMSSILEYFKIPE